MIRVGGNIKWWWYGVLTFPFSFTFSRYSLTTSLNAQNGKSSFPLLWGVLEAAAEFKHTSMLPSVLAWSKACYAGSNGSVNEVFLGVGLAI